MSRALERRLERVERLVEPPKEPHEIVLIAADDPDAERLIAEHDALNLPYPTLIILTGVERSLSFGEW